MVYLFIFLTAALSYISGLILKYLIIVSIVTAKTNNGVGAVI